MKRINYHAGILLCLIGLLPVSCDSDDENLPQTPKPTIRFMKTGEDPVTAYPGTVLDFTVEMTATAGIQSVAALLDSEEIPGSTKSYPDGTEQATYRVTYTVKAEETGKTLNFVILALDRDGKKSNAEYTVYIRAAKPRIALAIPDEAPATVTAGETVTFCIEVTSAADLKSIRTFRGDIELIELKKITFPDPNRDAYVFTYATSETEAGQTLSFIFEATDANGGKEKAAYEVAVTRAVKLDIDEFYGIRLGAQACPDAGPFLNTAAGEVYERAGATARSAAIDIALFYSNNSYGYYLVAPSDASIEAIFKAPDPIAAWPQRNDTKLKTLATTAEEFSALDSKAALEALYTGSPAEESGKLTVKLGVGSTIGFKTAEGKYGVLIVRSFANGSSKGNITVDMKIQQ